MRSDVIILCVDAHIHTLATVVAVICCADASSHSCCPCSTKTLLSGKIDSGRLSLCVSFEDGVRSARTLLFRAMPSCPVTELAATTGGRLAIAALLDSPALNDCVFAEKWLEERVVACKGGGLTVMGKS